MSKKVYSLVTGIVGGVSTIAIAIVTFVAPLHATLINTAIGIALTATLEICNLFVKSE